MDFLQRCLHYDSYRRPTLQQLLAHAFIRKAGSDRVEPSFVDPNLIRQSLVVAHSDERGVVSCPAHLRQSLLDKKDKRFADLQQSNLLTSAPSPVKQHIFLSLQKDTRHKKGMKSIPRREEPQQQLLFKTSPVPDAQHLADLQLLQSNRFNSLPVKTSDPHAAAALLKSEILSQREDSLASEKHWDAEGDAEHPQDGLARGPQIGQSGVLPNLESQGTLRAAEVRLNSLEASLLRKQQNFTFEAPRPPQDSDSQPICQSQFLPISEHLFDEQFGLEHKRKSFQSSQQLLDLSLGKKHSRPRHTPVDREDASRFPHVSIPLVQEGVASKKLERVDATFGPAKNPARLGFLNSEQEPRPKNSNIEDSTPNDIAVKKRTFDFVGLAPQNKPVSANNFLRVDLEQKASHTTDLKVSLSRNTKVSQNPGLSKEMHSRLPFSGAKSVSGGGPARDAEDCSDMRDEGRRISQIFFSNKTPHIHIMEEKGTTEANSPAKAGGFTTKRPRIALNLSSSRNEITRKADTHLKESRNPNFSFSFKSQSQDQPPVGSDASFEQSGKSDAQL